MRYGPARLAHHVATNACGDVAWAHQAAAVAAAPHAWTEAAFQAVVLAVAERERWLCSHVRKAYDRSGRLITPTSSPGFPDLVLVRAPQVLFLELKAQAGTASPAQRQWIGLLQRCGPGVQAWVVRPTDWPALLTTLAAPRQ